MIVYAAIDYFVLASPPTATPAILSASPCLRVTSHHSTVAYPFLVVRSPASTGPGTGTVDDEVAAPLGPL